MQNNALQITADGSHSVYSDQFNALYHSKHGAIQESLHVFIEAGLKYYISKNESSKESLDQINILEMGFGTGLNLLLTLIESENRPEKIHYSSVEAYPIGLELAYALNYPDLLNRTDLKQVLNRMHKSNWNIKDSISDKFSYTKHLSKIEEASFEKKFDVVFYDAFAPECQEELWTPALFNHITQFLNPGAVLVSYCAKGDFKRALKFAGFEIQKISGPPGKREMIRGVYNSTHTSY